MQRYFVSKKNEKFILLDSDFHHIKDVMRIKDNDNIICINDGKSFLCAMHYLKDSYEIEILKDISNDVELPIKVNLYQALIKNEHFDLVMQKACELGASDIYPTIFNRSVIKIDEKNKDNKINRYQKIVKEASEQSHRQIVPTVHDFINVKDIKLKEKELGLVAFENDKDFHSLAKALDSLNNYDEVSLVIGPEGGFSQDEISYLTKIGFISVSLGKRILRSETASLYGLSLISYYLEGK